MTDFWLDNKRNIIAYKGEPGILANYIPDLKRLNGSYFAFPKTLPNLQVASYYNYPTPEIINDSNYDFPIAPPFKPLPHQKTMANFMALHRKCFNLSDMGCVGGETLIDTASGKISIADLELATKSFLARTITNEGPRYIEVPAPFKKGHDDLFRVTFKSGRSIVVTKRHVFLTCRGWVSCENLAVSESLPVFDAYPQQSIWEPCRVKFQPNDRHWLRITSDSQCYFDIPVYDAPLLRATNIAPVLPPLVTDVPLHTHARWQMDDVGNVRTNMVPLECDLLSKIHYDARIDQGEMGSFLSLCATKQTDNQFHISAQYLLFPSQHREVHEDQGLQLCIPTALATAPPFDTVTHIAYERTDVYYDMEIPTHANYVAHGLCNHNTMKTLATLWAADFLMKQHEPGTFRAIVVAPLSTLERVWGKAIFENFLNRRTFEVVHGTPTKRSQLLNSYVDFYIINYDGVGIGAHTRRKYELDGFSKQLLNRKDIRLAVIDEASAYKDSTTLRHRIARDVLARREYLWLLTGTPTPNVPTDAYGLAKLVNNAYGKSKTGFLMETMYKPFPKSFKWLAKKDGYEKAAKLLSPSIRYELKDIWNGPECVTQQRAVELTPDQKKMMAELKHTLQVTLKSGKEIGAINEAAARQKFIQISLGAIYDEAHKVHAIDAKPRIAVLNEILDEAPGKFLVFAPLTSVVNFLFRELKKRNVEVVNGEVSQKARTKIFADFQEGQLQGIIADPGTMAHGLDLWKARTVIWFGPTDKAELYAQANRRAHRPGQKYPVSIVQIVSNPLEIEIFKRLENNLSLQGSLLTIIQEGS